MNAQELAEIGSWLAAHGQTLMFGQPQSMDAAKSYWAAAKCRLQRWSTALRMFGNDLELEPDDPNFHDPWPAMQLVIQEILISELLTRVWSAVMVGHDWKYQTDELKGLAHSVHIGHLEAKNRAIRTMLKGRGVNEAEFDRLNQLRHRIERWTDLFLSQLPCCDEARVFAFDAARVADFRSESGLYSAPAMRLRQQVLSASMKADLAEVADCFPANPELNHQIGAGIIACFSADRFNSYGLPKSARMMWVEKSHVDTEYFIDQLIDLENQSEQHSVAQFATRGVN